MAIDLFGNDSKIPETTETGRVKVQGRTKDGAYINNPMHVHGIIETERCKNCIHIVAKRFSKTYYKCALRGNVDKCSPKSDHKVNWKACGKFEKEPSFNHPIGE